jgi:hypothetical protein
MSAVHDATNFAGLAGAIGVEKATEMSAMLNDLNDHISLYSDVDEALSHIDLMSSFEEGL